MSDYNPNSLLCGSGTWLPRGQQGIQELQYWEAEGNTSIKFEMFKAEALWALHLSTVHWAWPARVVHEFRPYASLVLTKTRVSEATAWDVSSPCRESEGDRRYQANKHKSQCRVNYKHSAQLRYQSTASSPLDRQKKSFPRHYFTPMLPSAHHFIELWSTMYRH